MERNLEGNNKEAVGDKAKSGWRPIRTRGQLSPCRAAAANYWYGCSVDHEHQWKNPNRARGGLPVQAFRGARRVLVGPHPSSSIFLVRYVVIPTRAGCVVMMC